MSGCKPQTTTVKISANFGSEAWGKDLPEDLPTIVVLCLFIVAVVCVCFWCLYFWLWEFWLHCLDFSWLDFIGFADMRSHTRGPEQCHLTSNMVTILNPKTLDPEPPNIFPASNL